MPQNATETPGEYTSPLTLPADGDPANGANWKSFADQVAKRFTLLKGGFRVEEVLSAIDAGPDTVAGSGSPIELLVEAFDGETLEDDVLIIWAALDITAVTDPLSSFGIVLSVDNVIVAGPQIVPGTSRTEALAAGESRTLSIVRSVVATQDSGGAGLSQVRLSFAGTASTDPAASAMHIGCLLLRPTPAT